MRRTLGVLRGSAGTPERVEEYRIGAGPDTTVLDALVDVQRTQDPTLAFRYACRVGMCGSCAMVVNGRERWACRTRLAALGDGPVSVRPLYHFPLLRDLVVDMAPFVAKLATVGAAFTPRPDAARAADVPTGSRARRRRPERLARAPGGPRRGPGPPPRGGAVPGHDPRPQTPPPRARRAGTPPPPPAPSPGR